MLFNLKIQTIGKIILSVVGVCLVIVAIQITIESTKAEQQENNSFITFVSENGITGSNRIKVMLNTQGVDDINMVDIQIPTTDIFSFKDENNELTFDNIEIPENHGWNTESPLFVSGTDVLTLYTTNKDYYFNGESIHILTLIVDDTGTITLGSNSRVHSESQGWFNSIGQTYTIVENDVPVITSVKYASGSINLNEATAVPYAPDFTIVLNDATDNIFQLDMTISHGNNVESIDNYFDVSQTVSSEGGAIIELLDKTYLDYNTEYILDINVIDDQGLSATSTVDFTTQIDNVRPTLANGQNTIARVTSMSGDGAVSFEMEVANDSGPGEISNYYIFEYNDLGSNLLNYTSSRDGIEWESYDRDYSVIIGKIANSDYVANIPQGASTMINGGFIASNNPAGIAFVAFATDEANNLTEPILLSKVGDVVHNVYGYKDGIIDLRDAKYMFRHMQIPNVCPIPAILGVGDDFKVNIQCR